MVPTSCVLSELCLVSTGVSCVQVHTSCYCEHWTCNKSNIVDNFVIKHLLVVILANKLVTDLGSFRTISVNMRWTFLFSDTLIDNQLVVTQLNNLTSKHLKMTSSKQSELDQSNGGQSATMLLKEVERLTRENTELVKLRQDNVRLQERNVQLAAELSVKTKELGEYLNLIFKS